MSLPPQLSFLRIGSVSAPHTLEIWLDYVCPFSAKITKNALVPVVKPLLTTGPLQGKVQLFVRLQVQPWHGSSLFTHEASLAVGKVSPEAWWDYHVLLMQRQDEFFDRPVADLTPTQIREKLVALAGEIPSIKSKLPEIQDLLAYKGSPNGGNAATNDIKWFVKLARQNGMHFSPTVVWDGIKNDNVSSSWGEKEWTEYFEANVKV